MDISQFESRKVDHIRYALEPLHQANGLSGLDQIHLDHEALPDLDFQEIEISTVCLTKKLKTPFYIAGMTAGHSDALMLNKRLALACQSRGWAMGVGSQRRELQKENLRSNPSYKVDEKPVANDLFNDSWKQLRNEVPELVMFANLGLSQIIQADLDLVVQLVKNLDAQALAIHVNVLQEAIQPEGTPYFKGGFQSLQKYCKEFPFPIILKETGCGFSSQTLSKIQTLNPGLAALDVSGLGGTHWGRIEGARAQPYSIHAQAAQTFANWGEPTVQSVVSATKILKKTEVWASGGVRTGLDAAKLIALGAHRIGFAQPALEAALEGDQALQLWMEAREYELKVALFCTGFSNIDQLRGSKRLNLNKESL